MSRKFFSKLPFLEVPRQVLVLHAPANCMIPFNVLHSRLSLCFMVQSVSQNIQTSDGVHSQHKQMNILQTITANGGALQVIQAQTVQKSSSRRAITSTTYSSQFSSNFTNGVGHGSFSSGHPRNSDLLVRLIKMFYDRLIDLRFVSIAHTNSKTITINSPSAHVHCITTKRHHVWRPYSRRHHRTSWLVLRQHHPTTPQIAKIIYFIMRIMTWIRTSWAQNSRDNNN